MAGVGIETSGLDQVTAYLREVGASQSAVDDALIDHGRLVVSDAARLAPSASGALRSAITSTYTPGAGGLVVSAGAERVPYAYTYHATQLGTSGGYMVFKIPAHTRRGHAVKAHKRLRAVVDNAYVFTAWKNNLTKLHTAVEAALAKAVGP